ETVQETDRHRLDLMRGKRLHRARDARLLQRRQHAPLCVDPLAHRQPQPARHQRRRQVDIDVVLLEAVLVADLAPRAAAPRGEQLRWIGALVAGGVPWRIKPTAPGSTPAEAVTCRTAASTPSSGARGVVRIFAV